MQFTTRSICSLFILFFPFFSYSNEWALVKENENIQIYAREQTSGLFEVKASTQVNTKPIAFINLLMDTTAGPEWIDNAVSVEVLASPNANTMIVQTLLNAPWPLKNRDMITQSETLYDQESGEVSLIITDKGDYAPETNNRKRMKNVMGRWVLKPIGSNTLITYQGSGKAGGVIPTWLSNRILVNSTFKSFEKMRKKITEAKYQ
jgi:hypothetical protein